LNYFMKNPQTTIAPTFLTHIISAIDGVKGKFDPYVLWPLAKKVQIWIVKRSVDFKMSFWCHRLDQNTNLIFSRISALASKKRSNQKSSVKESK
jgi:hypothetical protein